MPRPHRHHSPSLRMLATVVMIFIAAGSLTLLIANRSASQNYTSQAAQKQCSSIINSKKIPSFKKFCAEEDISGTKSCNDNIRTGDKKNTTAYCCTPPNLWAHRECCPPNRVYEGSTPELKQYEATNKDGTHRICCPRRVLVGKDGKKYCPPAPLPRDPSLPQPI